MRALAVVLVALAVTHACRAGEVSEARVVEVPTTASGALAPEASTRSRGRTTLGRRLEVLSRALDLDEGQRAQLVIILEAQRAAVTKIWSDPALLPAERAPATRAVEEHTADQIRAILSDKQKQRYNPAKPQSAKTAPPDVSKWMEFTSHSNRGDPQ